MKKIQTVISSVVFVVLGAWVPAAVAQDKFEERLDTAADVLQELINAPDAAVPEELLEDAECVAVIPGVKKAAFGFGDHFLGHDEDVAFGERHAAAGSGMAQQLREGRAR